MLYRRQFLAATRDVPVPAGWRSTSLGPLRVSAHPELEVSCAAGDGAALLGLGTLLDPAKPALTSAEVAATIAADCHDFPTLERRLAALGGRWALVARISMETRIYPDAAGTRSVFFLAPGADGGFIAGSQPRLLAEAVGIARDLALEQRFRQHPVQNSWPGELTPYPGIRQLLPNHFLEVPRAEPRRFWPVEPIARVEIGEAAARINRVLTGTLSAAFGRGRVLLPLTGGYDSRVLFACALAGGLPVETFANAFPDTPYHDLSIPRRLARLTGTRFTLVRPAASDASLEALLRRNMADMVWDPGLHHAATYRRFGEVHATLWGQIAEIARCFYFPDGVHPPSPDAAGIAALAGYRDNPVAVAEIARWRATVGDGAGPALLDLYYWEHRLGNWASLLATAFDTVTEIVQPYNCRDLLVTALGADVEFRREPYELFRRVCALACPKVLEVPFNEDWRDDLAERARAVVPWPVQRWWRAARMKRAGLVENADWR